MRHSLQVLIVLSLSACAVGPNYRRPAAPLAPAYKEDQGWKAAAPSQIPDHALWWSIYQDPPLDALERQIDISNQTLKAAEAAYRAARAAVGVDRGALLPTISVTGSEVKSRSPSPLSSGSAGATPASAGAGARRDYSAQAQGNWQIDLWGRIRRTVEADLARAQASAADLAAARLSAQAALAEDYFQLRAADEQERLLQASVVAFTESLRIARNRVKAGVATPADVYSAQTQLENTQAAAIGVQLTRAKLEHAIAVLTGQAPASLAIPTGVFAAVVPIVPAGVPSSLLERRPDIAATERGVAAANAGVGVATSAWFPNLQLTGNYGYSASALSGLIKAANSAWSFGPSLAETLFNGGARLSETRQARALYDESVANYRQTVLSALQQVEDDLSSLRVLQEQNEMQNTAVADARRSEEIALNQYKAGVSDYTAVLTAQTTRLSAEVNAVNIQSQRLTTSVELIASLGGGWSAPK
jgi:NodT family efflux transporter outer membrane factor (OMF) lipoprotein